MLGILEFSKQIVAGVITRGGEVIDATVGNGHDTLFLAERVGRQGRVYGFDVQAEALRSARSRLEEAGCVQQVSLIHAGHESMQEALPDRAAGGVEAVMFNLGYLPGGSNKALTTQPETTVAALESASRLLRPGGIISIVVYTGHSGGPQEAVAVEEWASSLDPEAFQVICYRFVNYLHSPPYLIAVEKHHS